MKKNNPIIFNALLRVEGVKGSPPKKWEKPSAGHDFWVLELCSREMLLDIWISKIIPKIKTQRQQLNRFKQEGWKTFLFVAIESSAPIRFRPELLSVLAKFNITLEYSKE